MKLTQIEKTCFSIKSFLEKKNRAYGNSVFDPMMIFEGKTKNHGIGIRIDDKLSRIKNGSGLKKNDTVDLIGYLILECIEQGWDDFDDLID